MTTRSRDHLHRNASRRYAALGRIYDHASLERLLYRAPRRRLLQLLAPAAGATVLDIGCGTGLNFAGVLNSIGSNGHLIGIDSSRSMLARAERRIESAGWNNVTLLHADVVDLLDVLALAEPAPDGIDAVLATYVLSVLDDDQPVWDALDQLARARPLRVAIADVATADSASPAPRVVYRLLAALGGADPHRQPCEELAKRATLTAHETYRHGHIHIATASYQRKTQREV